MVHSMAILAYLGPETMLPMTSVVAGVVGVLMMFGRNFYRFLLNAFQALTGRTKRASGGSHQSRKIGSGPVGGIVRDDAARQAGVENGSIHS